MGKRVLVEYIITDGEAGNGPSVSDFQGSLLNQNATRLVPDGSVAVTTVQGAINGGEVESTSSIKYFARLYSAQYRAVTSRTTKQLFLMFIPILSQ